MKPLMYLSWAIASASMLAVPPASAQQLTNWDGLVQVKSKQFDLVFLQPGADFRRYTKILIEPTDIAFAKNWQRDYNRSSILPPRISDRDVQDAVSASVAAANDIFVSAWTKGGYSVVTKPGPHVLRVKTGIVNISINSPDPGGAGARSYAYSRRAGAATLFVEVRDSLTGALLGRAVDQGVAGGDGPVLRTASANRADFRQLVETWAKISVRGLSELKSRPVAGR